jgi:AcrR family transcriptional regulator
MNDTASSSTPTREKLLLVARRLFAGHGYDGTSVRDITGQADANLGAVTYHFGTKQALYEAVISSLIDPMRAGMERAVQGPGTPLDRIERIVRALFAQFARYPEQPAIMLHELARQRSLPRPVQEWVGLLMTTVMTLIEEGQKEGSILPGPLAPLAMSVVSQPFFFAVTRSPWARSPALGPLRVPDTSAADLACILIRRSLEVSGRKS